MLLISADPGCLVWFFAVNSNPPTDHVTVCDHDSRHINCNIAVAILAEVEHIRLHLFDQQLEIPPRFLDVALSNFLPFQAIFSRAIVEPSQRVHPRSLMRQRKFAKANESDSMPGLRQAGN